MHLHFQKSMSKYKIFLSQRKSTYRTKCNEKSTFYMITHPTNTLYLIRLSTNHSQTNQTTAQKFLHNYSCENYPNDPSKICKSYYISRHYSSHVSPEPRTLKYRVSLFNSVMNPWRNRYVERSTQKGILRKIINRLRRRIKWITTVLSSAICSPIRQNAWRICQNRSSTWNWRNTICLFTSWFYSVNKKNQGYGSVNEETD